MRLCEEKAKVSIQNTIKLYLYTEIEAMNAIVIAVMNNLLL